MNDQEFDNVTRSLRKSWSRQGTRNLRTYVLELQAMRNELGEAISLLAELRNDSTDTGARGRIDAFLAGTQGRVKAHVAAGIGADPQAKPVPCRSCNDQPDPDHPGTCSTCHRNGWDQVEATPVVTPKFDTDSQAYVYQFGKEWLVACKDGTFTGDWPTKEAAETWARENGYGIVRK